MLPDKIKLLNVRIGKSGGGHATQDHGARSPHHRHPDGDCQGRIPATTLGLMSDVWAAGMAYAQA